MSRAGRQLGRALVVVCALGLLLAGAPAAMAAAGELDSGFASGGLFTSSFQTEPSGTPPRDQSATVDSQRRTVIAATHVDAQNRRHLDVMRLTSQGALDTSFNPSGPTPGIVEIDFSAYVGTIDVYARGVALVGGDKIVALGWVHDTNGNDFTALVRLGSAGSYDTTFGANHDGRTVDSANPNYTGFPDALAVDNLGRILVGGSCGSSCRGVVARYTSTGARDTTGFNASDAVHPGVVAIGQGSDVSSLALAADGTGDVLAADGSSSSDEAVIARIRPDGTLDPTFGSGGATPGVVESGMGCQACASSGGAFAFGVAAGPGGAVYATGQVSDPGGQSMRLLRLTSAGDPDPAFGSGTPATGVVAAPGGIRGVSVALDGAACPVIVGYGLRRDQQVPNTQIVAARFTGAGALDQAFNPAGPNPGTATFPLGSRALGETVVLQDDGKIVIGGEVDQFGNATIRNAVALRLQGGGCGAGAPAPTVVTSPATNISSDGATLNGTVNPNGAQVSDCHFDYGTTAQYGSRAPCSPSSPGAGTSPVAVSATLSGLGSGKTWNYRLVATGPGGTSTGDNQTFTTLSAPTSTTLTTSQTWQTSPGGPVQGSSITVPFDATGERDEATITGDNTFVAAGTVTFGLYRQAASGPQCTQASQVFTSTNRTAGGPTPFAVADSDPVSTQLAPGTYYWTAAYSGDSRNQPSSSPCGAETLTVTPRPPSVVTGQATDVTTDRATFNGTVNPNGSQVTDCHFDYGPSLQYGSRAPCSPSPGAGTSPVAVSATLSGLGSGKTWNYRVVATGPGGTITGGNQTFTTLPPPTTLTTSQFWETVNGASITVPPDATGERDTAQVVGSGASTVTGTVTFRLYSDPACTAASLVFSSTNATPGSTLGFSAPDSDPVPQQLAPGTYYWTAAYSGDSKNQPSASPCGAETLTVQPPQPTTLTTVQTWGVTTRGASITVPGGTTGERDEATVAGSNASAPSGTVTFSLYRRAPTLLQCRGTPVFTSTDPVSGVPGASKAASGFVTAQLAPGTYYWTAAYSGDSRNQPSTSPCGAETLTIQLQPTRLITSQTWGRGTASGASISVPAGTTGESDVGRVYGSNASTPSGTVTFRLYSDPACTAASLVFSSTNPATGSSPGVVRVGSDPVTQVLGRGTYYWTAAYSGDIANAPSTSPCGAETLTVAPLRISPYGALISTQALTLTMGCTAPPCTVRITITLLAPLTASDARRKAKSKPPVITLAGGKVTIRKHGPRTVRLRLTAAGRRFVASHHGQVTVNAALAITVHGHTRVINQRLKIKIITASKRQQH